MKKLTKTTRMKKETRRKPSDPAQRKPRARPQVEVPEGSGPGSLLKDQALARRVEREEVWREEARRALKNELAAFDRQRKELELLLVSLQCPGPIIAMVGRLIASYQEAIVGIEALMTRSENATKVYLERAAAADAELKRVGALLRSIEDRQPVSVVWVDGRRATLQ